MLVIMRILAPGEVDLYILHDDDRAAVPRLTEALLSSDESMRLAALARPVVRREFLLARVLVRSILSNYAPVDPPEWRFVVGEHGKPEIEPRVGLPPLRFNLAHTTGMFALAVTCTHDVGVDVEWLGRRVGASRMATRFFAQEEARDVLSLAESDQTERFLIYWTLKEAYVKARGLGLTVPLRAFRFFPDGVPITIGLTDEIAGDVSENWQFVRHRPSPQHVLALALRCATAPLRVNSQIMSSVSAFGDLYLSPLDDAQRQRKVCCKHW